MPCRQEVDGTGLAGGWGEGLYVSWKLVGIGVLVAGGLTAAVTGYVVLREPAAVPVPEAVISTPGEPAPEILTPPTPPAPTTRPASSSPSALATEPAEVSPTTPTPPTPPARYVPDPPGVAPDPVPPPVLEPVVEPVAPMVELTVERNSVIGIRLDFAISTKTARVEDRVAATVSREVTVGGRVAIPLGARLEGTVTAVDRGGRFRERPRLGLRFDTLILTDGTRLSISTDIIFRDGDSPSSDATATVGAGAVAGAILGSVLAGKKGAILGGVAGAAGGTATVMTGDTNETALREGAPLTVRLTADLTVRSPQSAVRSP